MPLFQCQYLVPLGQWYHWVYGYTNTPAVHGLIDNKASEIIEST